MKQDAEEIMHDLDLTQERWHDKVSIPDLEVVLFALLGEGDVQISEVQDDFLPVGGRYPPLTVGGTPWGGGVWEFVNWFLKCSSTCW